MYRLLMYGLFALALVSIALSALGVSDLPAADKALGLLTIPITVTASFAFAKFFKAIPNLESASITALIIYFLFDPPANLDEFLIVALAGVVAVGTKFLIAPSKRHLLNPAAAAAVILGLLEIDFAVWWIARSELVIPMAILGFLVLRKLHRFSMFFAFFAAAVLTSFFVNYDADPSDVWTVLETSITVWPTLFLGTIMLTEPITTPPGRRNQLLFGAFIGLLMMSGLNVGHIYMTPELALVIGNAVFYFAFLQRRVGLKLIERKEVADSVFSFSFEPSHRFGFTPGEYLEVTAPLSRSDSRGNRRSFSLASAPSEKVVKLGIRLPQEPSRFKKFMMDMKPGDYLYTNHRQGDFTLPKKGGRYVLIAGGIGITPFRSMVAEAVLNQDDSNDIVLFYQASETNQFAYKKILSNPKAKELGIQTVYVSSSKNNPDDWKGESGFIDAEMLSKHTPDFKERTFYLSGPNAMVEAYTAMLKKAGVPRSRIRHDYFSGY